MNGSGVRHTMSPQTQRRRHKDWDEPTKRKEWREPLSISTSRGPTSQGQWSETLPDGHRVLEQVPSMT